ncbi:uncharacterized protein ELE39_003391 [Cryptosporidium sp. chipmunk genotype I]|uniref:uncharacterized protein n=1 Tax=Cryptosporidium sp. chipmunk genotype I TaxID=1280935 RepID=UPI003519DF5D|nr:hypothetical protein ELE39_003391 [Cryptosporidium sp. chipmunk genotype I]
MTSFSTSLQDFENEALSNLNHFFELIMDCKFNEEDNLLYTSHVDGKIFGFEFDFHENKLKSASKVFGKKGSCRNIEFMNDNIIATYNTGETILLDKSGKAIWKTSKSGVGINAVTSFSSNIIATGDDEGFVEMWDIRDKSNKSFSKFRDYEDCINDIYNVEDKNSLIVISGDTLGVYDIKSITSKKNKDHLLSLSDPQEENILCSKAIRVSSDNYIECISNRNSTNKLFQNNSKIVCGTDEGNLLFFSWGNFGDCTDRMLIPFVDGFENDNSVEHIQIYQDQFAIISTSDGILKVVEFFPNEILGTLTLNSRNKSDDINIECSKTTVSNSNNFIIW